MKFLVTATPRRLQLPPAGMIEACRAWLNARLADKTVDFCHAFITGGGVSVMNADSHDALATLLLEYPGFMANDWSVQPLCDINHSLDQVNAMVTRLTA